MPNATPWNKGQIIGQKRALKPPEVWSIRTRIQIKENLTELAMFNLAIDSKLRACDLIKLRVCDVCNGKVVKSRTKVIQQKTKRPVEFEIGKQSQSAIIRLIDNKGLESQDYLFHSRLHNSPHISRRQYARLLDGWVSSIGLNVEEYGTHSMRRTKAAQVYKKTGNLRAVQLLLGHAKLDSTVNYLGIDLDDALHISEQIEL